MPKPRRTYPAWLAEVQRLSGNVYGYFSDHYRFRDAFDRGLTPYHAVRDCLSALELG